MNTFFLNTLFSQKGIEAFSWTLIHSLWQGLVLAVLVGVILLMTRKARPALRYALLTGLLLTFLAVSAGTFWWEYHQIDRVAALVPEVVLTQGTLHAGYLIRENLWVAEQEDMASKILRFGTEHAVLIVAVWWLVFLLKTFQAASGLYYIHRIRHHRIRPVPERWHHRVVELAHRLKINRRIALVESERVKVPLVAGFLKPMILVPMGFMTSLPTSQLEAILLHELAHVRRKDYLVNLFQSFSENIFFFNPAVLWLSYLIREEREHCCDDLAIAVTQNKTSFVNALVQFQEYKIAASAPVLAFAGKRNHLLDRIKRIIYNHNKQLDAMEKLFVTASLITVSVLSVAFSPSSAVKVPTPSAQPNEVPLPKPIPALLPQAEPTPLAVAMQDTIVPKQKGTGTSVSTIQITRNDKRYRIVDQDGKITELEIDGKTILEDQIESYLPEIEPILAELKVEREKAEVVRAQADVARQEAIKMREQAEVMRREAETYRAQAEVARQQARQMREDAQQQRRAAEDMRVASNQNRLYAEEMKAQANQNRNENIESIRAQADEARQLAEEARRHAQEARRHAEVFRGEAEVMRKEAEKKRAEYETMQADFINELMEAGVIRDKTGLSYKLSADELIVNGVKQPDALHQKLKAKYLKDMAAEMVYNWKGRTGYTTTGWIYTR
ncbi:M56 family metallopeptidase [Salmonirosea aquatica]|uniref:M48 family metalloprotease n=1 Tax=Salmonirosea aquatica TaxID=2654236 RepID=A0A7C9BFQ8_9BACT|nr:M48 family metalloprotease [Cytophagaceae bacterium SJW1-29]